MRKEPEGLLDGPIAGQSLTAPLGARPWQQPPRFSKPSEALSYYIERITEDEQTDQIMDILEMGVPIDLLVDTMQLGGVMEGLHSVDVGIIITPALIEAIKNMAEKAEVEHVVFGTDKNAQFAKPTEVALGMQKLRGRKKGITIIDLQEAPEEPEVEMEEAKQQPRGLMARRAADGI